MIRKFIKRLFCRHDWTKIAFREQTDDGTRYSVRTYVCCNCGKRIHVDGRRDPYAKSALTPFERQLLNSLAMK